MKGTYCLKIFCKNKSRIKIGALGEVVFKKGIYFYIGSALNSLEKRLQRHLRISKKLHWHIDYLLNDRNIEIIEIYFLKNPLKMECITSKSIEPMGIPIKNFGSSDCNCNSHLFFIKTSNIVLVKNALCNLNFGSIPEIDLKKIKALL